MKLQLTFEERLQIAMYAALDTDEDVTVYDFPLLKPKPATRWQFEARNFEGRLDRALQMWGLPVITQDMRDAFWAELRKGQSVHEDAGGYKWRCWYAAFGHSVKAPYTYQQAIADLAGPAE